MTAPADVEMEMVWWLTTRIGNKLPVRTNLSYDPDDPYAVHVLFHVTGQPVGWSFARELVDAGLHNPTGDGDVRVSPQVTASGDHVVVFCLSSPNGTARFEASRHALMRFLRRTYARVPAGREADRVDVDAAVTRLLAGAGEPAPNPTPAPGRTWTPQIRTPAGRRVVVKRACNGCGALLGDVTDEEVQAAIAGRVLPDVTGECLHCEGKTIQ